MIGDFHSKIPQARSQIGSLPCIVTIWVYASNAHTVERLTHFNSTKYYVKMQMIPIGIHLN